MSLRHSEVRSRISDNRALQDDQLGGSIERNDKAEPSRSISRQLLPRPF